MSLKKRIDDYEQEARNRLLRRDAAPEDIGDEDVKAIVYACRFFRKIIDEATTSFPFVIGKTTLRDGKTMGVDTPIGKWFHEVFGAGGGGLEVQQRCCICLEPFSEQDERTVDSKGRVMHTDCWRDEKGSGLPYKAHLKPEMGSGHLDGEKK